MGFHNQLFSLKTYFSIEPFREDWESPPRRPDYDREHPRRQSGYPDSQKQLQRRYHHSRHNDNVTGHEYAMKQLQLDNERRRNEKKIAFSLGKAQTAEREHGNEQGYDEGYKSRVREEKRKRKQRAQQNARANGYPPGYGGGAGGGVYAPGYGDPYGGAQYGNPFDGWSSGHGGQ
ncbi:MAG: hypothetical protein Q9179_002848 [Wetmoreana sp. 5 TL-2023]